jgi:hypothetical protein
MVCPKCGGTNVRSEQKQVFNNDVKFKAGNGCLWWVLLGWLYILYIALKWIAKLFYFIFIGWWVAIIQKNKKDKESRTVVHICQDCGYKWESVSEKNVISRVSAATNTADNSSKASSDDVSKHNEEKARISLLIREDGSHREESIETLSSIAVMDENVPSRTVPEETSYCSASTCEDKLLRTVPKKASTDTSDNDLWHRPSATGFDASENNDLS